MENEIDEMEIIKTWKRLRRSQRISLLEEYEFSLSEICKLSDKERNKFKRLILENMKFREVADWSIVCDLKNIEDKNKIDLVMRYCRQ